MEILNLNSETKSFLLACPFMPSSFMAAKQWALSFMDKRIEKLKPDGGELRGGKVSPSGDLFAFNHNGIQFKQ